MRKLFMSWILEHAPTEPLRKLMVGGSDGVIYQHGPSPIMLNNELLSSQIHSTNNNKSVNSLSPIEEVPMMMDTDDIDLTNVDQFSGQRLLLVTPEPERCDTPLFLPNSNTPTSFGSPMSLTYEFPISAPDSPLTLLASDLDDDIPGEDDIFGEDGEDNIPGEDEAPDHYNLRTKRKFDQIEEDEANDIHEVPNGHFEVESIEDIRFTGAERIPEWKVKWKGYPESEMSWEGVVNLQ